MKFLNTLFLLVFFLVSQIVLADALVQNRAMRASTIIEYYVDESGVRAKLEIGVNSVAAFKNLLPDAVYQKLGYGNKPQSKRIKIFFTKQLALLGKDGRPLPGKLQTIGPSKRILRDPINGTPLPNQDDAPQVIAATVFYPFKNRRRPKQLVFISPPARDIGFVVYHNGVAVNDFRYLGSGYKLNLDWNDPWYSAFATRNLRRKYSAPMSGFIYVEPFEVRKEIIARPKDLQRWVDLGLKGKKIIPVDMQPIVKQKVAEFLAKHHPVTIDGKPVKGILDSVNFLERTLTSSRVIDPPETLNIDAAILGVIFVYPRNGLPKKVVMDWDLWDKRIKQVPVSAVDQAGGLPTLLQPDWRKLEWENFLTNPYVPALKDIEPPVTKWQAVLYMSLPVTGLLAVLALIWLARAVRTKQPQLLPASVAGGLLVITIVAALLGGSNSPGNERASAIVGDLLHNLYRSFDYRDESDIYDKLAQSVTGELLTDIFLETKRSLVLANQGGARAKVKKVELEGLELKSGEAGNGFSAEVDWTVQGSVGHWGHIHQRNNKYKALLTVVVDDNQWKLKKMTVLQEERIK